MFSLFPIWAYLTYILCSARCKETLANEGGERLHRTCRITIRCTRPLLSAGFPEQMLDLLGWNKLITPVSVATG